MSGSFPFVSPAVNLPTKPPHRVVDAAYYDNYGIQTAAAWIYNNRGWLMAETSGVVVIQIRDSTSIIDRVGIHDVPESFWQRLGHGFQFLTSPIAGVYRARFTSGLFRNEQAIQYLSDMFTREMRSKMPEGESRRFLTTLDLENAAEISSRPHTTDWPGLEFVPEEQGGTALARAASSHRAVSDHSTGVSMTWYLTRAEREALDFSIPELKPGSPASDSSWRKKHVENLRKAIEEMGSTDPRRVHAWNDFQRVTNYEKIQQLKEWWKLGLNHKAREAGTSKSPSM
jgi:hypothetical protein